MYFQPKEPASGSLSFGGDALKDLVGVFPFEVTDLEFFSVYKVQTRPFRLTCRVKQPKINQVGCPMNQFEKSFVGRCARKAVGVSVKHYLSVKVLEALVARQVITNQNGSDF